VRLVAQTCCSMDLSAPTPRQTKTRVRPSVWRMVPANAASTRSSEVGAACTGTLNNARICMISQVIVVPVASVREPITWRLSLMDGSLKATAAAGTLVRLVAQTCCSMDLSAPTPRQTKTRVRPSVWRMVPANAASTRSSEVGAACTSTLDNARTFMLSQAIAVPVASVRGPITWRPLAGRT